MRRQFGKTIIELAEKDERIVLLFGDVKQAMDEFEKKFPDKIFDFGIREQAMVSAAAGMAIEGLRPIVYSITPFLLRRAYEQIRIDVDQQNLPVVVIGYSDYPGEGPTQNIETPEVIQLAKSFENVVCYTPTSATETAQAMLDAHASGKPSVISLKKDPDS